MTAKTIPIRAEKPPSPPYLIDEILPSKEIHLLAGPSGSGKTRWLFDTLARWEQGLPILGHQSHPVPWLYVAGDRSWDGVNRTLDAMEIDRDSIKVLPAWDLQLTLSQILSEIEQQGVRLAILEGFGQYVDAPGHSHQVRNFLCSVSAALKCSDVTVIGVVESPKMKPKEAYANPRQRVSGVATWSHHVETIFLVEPYNAGKVDDPRRVLTVCPRNSASISRTGTFSQAGHLVFPPSRNGHGHGALLSPEFAE